MLRKHLHEVTRFVKEGRRVRQVLIRGLENDLDKKKSPRKSREHSHVPLAAATRGPESRWHSPRLCSGPAVPSSRGPAERPYGVGGSEH